MLLRVALGIFLLTFVAGTLIHGRTQALSVAGPSVASSALYSDTPSVPSNSFTTQTDWTPPTTITAKVINSIGYVDYLMKGDAYQVCASISDDGNPPSGVSSSTANLAVSGNVITNGATSEPLNPGSFTCEGASYNYQSGILGAKNNLGEGTLAFEVTAIDALGYQATTSWSVTVDNTSPSLSAFSTTNAGTAGLIESGDTYQASMSESTIDLDRILEGWNGSSTAIFVKVQNAGAPGGKDKLWTCKANTADCGGGTGADEVLGDVELADKNYVTADVVFNATLSWNAVSKTFYASIGSCVSGCGSVITGGNSNAKFTAISGSSQGGIRDKAGNSASSTATESGVHF